MSTQGPRYAWGALLAVAACGARAQSDSPSAGAGGEFAIPQSAGAAGEPDALGDPSANGGAGTTAHGGAPGDGDAGAAGDRGAAGTYTSLIASGTRTCETEAFCFGLACYAPASFYPSMCLARCETDDNLPTLRSVFELALARANLLPALQVTF